MKTRFFAFPLVIIACVLFVMCGNKDNKKYCPAYPREKTDYVPVNLKGERLRYLVGNDTVELIAGTPVFSPKYEKDWTEVLCESQMIMQLSDKDSSSRIDYTKIAVGDDPHSLHGLSLQISLFHKNGSHIIYCDMYEIQPLNQWTSPFGEIFQDAAIRATEKDTLYLSKTKGLLRYVPDPEKSDAEEWCLLPEKR